MLTNKERERINELIKLFIANQWCITPEGITAFAMQYGEHIDVEDVIAVQQKKRDRS